MVISGLNSHKNCLQAPHGTTNLPSRSAAMAMATNSRWPWWRKKKGKLWLISCHKMSYLGYRLDASCPLGADGQAVAGVLHVAASDGLAVGALALDGGTHLDKVKGRDMCVAVWTKEICNFLNNTVNLPCPTQLQSPMYKHSIHWQLSFMCNLLKGVTNNSF